MSFLSFISSLAPWVSHKLPAKGFMARIPLEQVLPPPPETPTWDERVEDLAVETPQDEIDAFVHFGAWLQVQSSNIKEIQYNPDASQLTVAFLNGYVYHVDDFSIREAESLARAPSKGIWYWDHVRVRGKGNFWATRKPYVFLSGVSSAQPQWTRQGGKKGAAVRKLHNLFTRGAAIRKPAILGKSISKILAPRRRK